jgi:hypothetical protein
MVGVDVIVAVEAAVGVAEGLKVGEGKNIVAVARSSNGISGCVRVFSILSDPAQPNVASINKHRTKTLTRISSPSHIERGNLSLITGYTHPAARSRVLCHNPRLTSVTSQCIVPLDTKELDFILPVP